MTASVLAIEAPAALVGRELELVRDARVVIEGGRITAIGPSDRVDLPDEAELIDATGMTLAPGFVDAHVHIGFAEPSEVARRGVLTVRDLGWPPDEIFPLVEASQETSFRGPRIVAAGTMITVPGGYPTRAAWAPAGTGAPVSSVAEAEAAVAANISLGATVIKVALNPPVGPTLPFELLVAVVDAAHEAGLKVTGHIFGLEELNKALEAGIDELAHMLMSPERIPTETLQRMVDDTVAVVPTLSIRSGSDRLIAIDNLRRFRGLGGRVVYGTDLGNEGPLPGIDRAEVQAMAEAEMSPLEIVRSATVEAAHWLGLSDTGVLQEGVRADLIGLRGDPTIDETSLTKVGLVLREGRRLS